MIKYLKILSFFLIVLINGNTILAQIPKDTSVKYTPIILKNDNPILAALDSLAVLKCYQKSDFTCDIKNLININIL